MQRLGVRPAVAASGAIAAPPAVLRACVAAARAAAESSIAPWDPGTTTSGTTTSGTTTSGVADPPQGTVETVIEGQRLALPATMADEMDFTNGQILGRIRGERFVSATMRATGEPCYVYFTASGGGGASCDRRDQLVARGGWLISRPGAGGSRDGLVIVPTKGGDLRFTTTPFFQVKAGSRLTIPGPDGSPRGYTVPWPSSATG